MPPSPSNASSRYRPSRTTPTSPAEKLSSATALETHAVLDAEREPVPREVRSARCSDDADDGCPCDRGDTGTDRRSRSNRTFALRYDFVALDQRAHFWRLHRELPPVKPR